MNELTSGIEKMKLMVMMVVELLTTSELQNDQHHHQQLMILPPPRLQLDNRRRSKDGRLMKDILFSFFRKLSSLGGVVVCEENEKGNLQNPKGNIFFDSEPDGQQKNGAKK
ncbi:hypothetical protein L5515_014238 [Caenorhabditis briggsae]|nr:hypothetical protein L5515_014238 [Caenorhabditis briggsae]